MNHEINHEFYSQVEKTTREFIKKATRNLSCSETKSLCSDIPASQITWSLGGLKRITSREALALVLYLPLINEQWGTLLRIELEQLAFKYRYQGLWRNTHKLLRLYEQDLLIYHFLGNIASESELFGNYLKTGLERLKKVNLYNPTRVKVNKPQRKRGYNDHGSRRENHKWLPRDIHLGPNPKKEDYREDYGNSKKSYFNFLWKG